MEDNPERSFALPSDVRHVSWKEIDADLGKDAWIVPRRTDAVRNYGFLLAAREKPDMIVTLDDDCYPSDAQARPSRTSSRRIGGCWTLLAATCRCWTRCSLRGCR